jgi:rhodanese-related sulfurtransferase
MLRLSYTARLSGLGYIHLLPYSDIQFRIYLLIWGTLMKKMIATGLLALFVSVGMTTIACAGEWDNLPQKKVTKLGLYMHPADAYKFVQDNKDKVLFIDVRTKEEVEFLGMASLVDANIPYMQNPDWQEWNDKGKNFKLVVNSNFAAEVARRLAEKKLTKDDAIVVICRSGDRSANAINLLAGLGYTKVYSVAEGYEGDMATDGPKKGTRSVNGWKNDGMPWGYELDKTKMYGFTS